MPPESPIHLYWSIRGEVACINHAPKSEQWNTERWQVLPATYRATFQCQHCSPDHIALARETTRKGAPSHD